MRHLRNILSLHIISSELLLLRIGLNAEECYWTFFTPNGYIYEVSQDLNDCLKEQSWTGVQTCIIKGQICKLLLSSDSHAKILEISKRGELLRQKVYEFHEKPPG